MVADVNRAFADDVDTAVQLAIVTLREASPDRWDAKAGSLDWTCWETAEHLADDLFSYAAQLGPRNPPLDTHLPFGWSRRREGGPANAINVDRAAGPAVPGRAHRHRAVGDPAVGDRPRRPPGTAPTHHLALVRRGGQPVVVTRSAAIVSSSRTWSRPPNQG
jgi:hypothetical protein